MDVSVENTSTLGRRLKISVPDATVKAQIQAKMAKLGREVSIKGFRPGKVPAQILQKRFGESIRLEVIEDLIRKSIGEAVQNNALQPAGVPKIEEIKNKSGENLEFVAAFEVFPQIVLGEMAQITIDRKVVNITDADVQKMITKLQDQFANWNDVDRAVAANDKISVDFARLLKEDQAKREEQKNVQMVVGVEGVLPGLSEALIGKNNGDSIEVDLRYPEAWPEGQSAGKEVKLWVTVHGIQEKQLLTEDELAEKLGTDKTDKTQFFAKIREGMEKELESVLRDELKEKVLEQLLEKNAVEIPHSLIEQEQEAIRHDEEARMKRSGQAGPRLSSEEAATEAKQRVQLGLLLNEVINKYHLKVTSDQIRQEIGKIASQFSQSTEIAEMYYRNKDLLHKVERKILLEEAVDAILKEVKVNETTVPFDEVMQSESP
jgi:trigger factor